MKCSTQREQQPIVRSGAPARGLWGAGLVALMLAALAPPASAQLHAPDIVVNEGEVAVFDIRLPRTYKHAVRYRYRTRNFTAFAGQNYEAQRGYLVFPVGQRSAQVRVRTYRHPDVLVRHFRLELSDRETFEPEDNAWSRAWAVIHARGLPRSKTITAEIDDVWAREEEPRNDYEEHKHKLKSN